MKGFKSAQHLGAGVTQAYIFPRAAWDVPAQRATMVDRIPFTQSAQVPALVMLLRHQSTITTLLRSCMATAASECDDQNLHFLLLRTSENLLLSHVFSGCLQVLFVISSSFFQSRRPTSL